MLIACRGLFQAVQSRSSAARSPRPRSPRPARRTAPNLLSRSRFTGIQRSRNLSGSHSGMREQHVHQAALHLPLHHLLVPAEQHGRVGGDVRLDQVGRVQLREIWMTSGWVGASSSSCPPASSHASLDGARAVEQPDEPVRGVGQPVELVARRVADDVPPLAAVVLPRICARAAAWPAGSPRGTRTRKMSGEAGGS